MKNRVIRDRYAALFVLSQRVLPSTTAINKVSALLRRFQPLYEATEKKIKDIIADHPTPDGWDDKRLPAPVAEARQKATEKMLDEAQAVKKVPDQMRLTEDDLPKVLKRDGGDSNVEGLAQAVVLLGGLYVPSTKEKELSANQPDGFEEEDTVAEEKVEDPRVPEHA